MLCFFFGFPKSTTHHSIRWNCWFCVGIKTPGNDLRCLPVMMQKQQNVQRASIAQIPDSVTGVSEVVFSPQVRYKEQVCTKNFYDFHSMPQCHSKISDDAAYPQSTPPNVLISCRNDWKVRANYEKFGDFSGCAAAVQPLGSDAVEGLLSGPRSILVPPSPLPASSSPSSSSRVSEKRDNRYFNEKSTSTTEPLQSILASSILFSGFPIHQQY